MKEIIPLNNPNPTELFAPGGLDAILSRIEEDVRAIVPNVDTFKGRKEITSIAARVAKSKTYLDGIGKDYVAELKAMPRQIDYERKAMRERLDALKEEVRRPLTEYEQREADRKAAIQERIEAMRTISDEWDLSNVAMLKTRVTSLENIAIDDSWAEFAAEAAKVKDASITYARAALVTAEKAQRLKAERQVREEQERSERETRIAAEAAQHAKQEAERIASEDAQREKQKRETERLRQENAKIVAQRRAEQAERAKEEAERRQKEAEQNARAQAEQAAREERERIEREAEQRAEEERRRAEDEENRNSVHEHMAAQLRQHVVSIEAARDLVAVIAAGRIDNLEIIY